MCQMILFLAFTTLHSTWTPEAGATVTGPNGVAVFVEPQLTYVS